LLDGHFVLRSGLHSREYFLCAILLQDTSVAAHVCGQLADKLRGFDCDTVISLLSVESLSARKSGAR
jgi:orotate phosphoribosyltransferase